MQAWGLGVVPFLSSGLWQRCDIYCYCASADLESADVAASPSERTIAEEPAAEGTSSHHDADSQEAEAAAGNGSGLQDDWELVNGKAGASDQRPPNPTEGAPMPSSTPPGAGGLLLDSHCHRVPPGSLLLMLQSSGSPDENAPGKMHALQCWADGIWGGGSDVPTLQPC